ncbi:MAG: hypothetical protein U0231_16890 [Nitrospiraceae bacterium]
MLEVGLGGRFDATNVVTPAATAITTIGLDHEQYLGSTLEQIAFEKAGIIKPGSPLVLGRVGEAAGRVIEERARAVGAPVSRLDREFRTIGESTAAFTYERDYAGRYDRLQAGDLNGGFQLDNAACAISLCGVLRQGRHRDIRFGDPCRDCGICGMGGATRSSGIQPDDYFGWRP